jgi:hypothetical protein
MIEPGEQGDHTDFINKSEADETPANDEGRVPKLESDGKLDGSFLRLPVRHVYTSSGTWTKQEGLKYIEVELVGAGAGGQGGGQTRPYGTDGGATNFGTHLSATGGKHYHDNGNFIPGVGSNGDINEYGGGAHRADTDTSSANPTPGGSSHFSGEGAPSDYEYSDWSNVYTPGHGAGGGGGDTSGASNGRPGTGGCGGGYSKKLILASNLGATEAYVVGAGGSGGNQGNYGNEGAPGGGGLIIVTEYY